MEHGEDIVIALRFSNMILWYESLIFGKHFDAEDFIKEDAKIQLELHTKSLRGSSLPPRNVIVPFLGVRSWDSLALDCID